MSALETGALPIAPRARAGLRSRVRALRLSPLALPIGLATAYAVLLVVRYPGLIVAQNADSDVASFYTLAAAVAHGHAGPVQFSTQGTWLQLGWMVLTAGLGAHRLLWELCTPALGLVTVAIVTRSVAGVGGRRSAVLCAAVLLAASPMVLMCAISVTWHNTTPLAAGLYGAHLVWVGRRRRSSAVLASILVVGTIGGVLVACDQLAGIVAVGPYLIAAAAIGYRTGSFRELGTAAVTICVTLCAWGATNLLAQALHLQATVPGFALSFSGVGHRALWLAEGVLRLGNGRWYSAHPALLTPLIVACAIVTGLAVVAMARLVGRAYRARGTDETARAAAAHCTFWAASVLCCVSAFVFSDRVIEASDQYLIVIMYAVAATVPLWLAEPSRGVGHRGVAASLAATIFVAGSLAGLASGETSRRPVTARSSAVAQLTRIERLVRRHHLGVGYAGYWDAAALQWSSHGQLQVHPLLGNHENAEAMYFMRAAAWYRVPATPSYLVLAPGDALLPDLRPHTLPQPAHVYRVGDVTIDAFPYDLSAFLVRSLIPVPGIGRAQLAAARRRDRAGGRP